MRIHSALRQLWVKKGDEFVHQEIVLNDSCSILLVVEIVEHVNRQLHSRKVSAYVEEEKYNYRATSRETFLD
jgi:hypothetical protein